MDWSKIAITDQEAKNRLNEFGSNKLHVKIKTPLWKKFLNQFKDINVLILMGAGFLALGIAFYQGHSEEATDAYVILGIVILNSLIGFIQEYKSEKAIEALQKMIAPQVRVIRNSTEKIIPARYLVPGDIMILTEGDKISADAVLLEANELKIDESALTGESLPLHKNKYIGETTNIDFENINELEKIYTGTAVVSGSATALVVHTGMKTKFGRIADLTALTEKDLSPLQKELFHIGVFVGKVTFLISASLFLFGIFLQDETIINALLFAVAVAVAAVPEGLPATITIALAIGVQRMAKKNAIIKQLSSVETLGSTTVICSDKTGTLTRNEMTVTQGYLASNQKIKFKGSGYIPEGEIQNLDLNNPDQQRLYSIMQLCNDANLIQENNTWKIIGDPTEGALLTAVKKTGFICTDFEKKRNFPFNSIRKRMSVIVKNNAYYLFTKGAPDSILEKSKYYLKNGEIKKLTPIIRQKIILENNQMADQALRVLAMAYRSLNKETANNSDLKSTDLENELIFVGLVGMIDPPRKRAKEAVKLCHKAGIRTIIITGDYGLTAVAIARQIGIVTTDNPMIITGKELNNLDQTSLRNILEINPEVIFARISPEHKLIVVDTLKDMGEVVAVTGDGVNDAPALKRADIGISMGITGTDVSKEAANMILADDSFATIVAAIEEGRTIYQNLRKFVWYIFSCNIGELITVFSAIILGVPAPLTAILILAVDLGTDVLPALALGLDPPEPGTMEQLPRDPKIRIMNATFIKRFVYMGILIGAIVIGVYIWDHSIHGWSDPLHASTIAFSILVIIQMINAFNSRSEKQSVFKLRSNYYLWGAVIISCLMVLAIVHLPFIQEIFKTVDLTLNDWLMVSGISIVVLIVEEMRKAVLKKLAD